MAVQRAGTIFGVAASRLLSAGNVGKLTAEVKKKARWDLAALPEIRGAAGRANARKLGTCRRTPIGSEPRGNTGPGRAIVLGRTGHHGGLLAKADMATRERRMGECVGKAAELEGNLEAAGWDIFEAVGKLSDDRQAKARGDPGRGSKQALAER